MEQDDGGADEIEGAPGLLILMTTITEAVEAMERDGADKTISRLPLVELGVDEPPQGRIGEPPYSRQGPLHSANLPSRCGERVLLSIRGELFRISEGVTDLSRIAVNPRPMSVGADQVCIETLIEQRRQASVSRARLECVESPVRQARDPRFKAQAEQVRGCMAAKTMSETPPPTTCRADTSTSLPTPFRIRPSRLGSSETPYSS